jgi:hypothetical protein
VSAALSPHRGTAVGGTRVAAVIKLAVQTFFHFAFPGQFAVVSHPHCRSKALSLRCATSASQMKLIVACSEGPVLIRADEAARPKGDAVAHHI